jgi:hypothetical protein
VIALSAHTRQNEQQIKRNKKKRRSRDEEGQADVVGIGLKIRVDDDT